VPFGRCASLKYQFQHKRTGNSAVWLGMARPVPYTCSQLNPPGNGSHGQLQLVFASYPDVSLSLDEMCAQRKAGRRQRARRRFACCLYPSHGPLRFIISRSRFALASTVRKTKRRRLNWYCLEKTPGIPGSINTILYEEASGHPEVQPLNLDRNGTHFVYPLLTNGTPFTYNCEQSRIVIKFDNDPGLVRAKPQRQTSEVQPDLYFFSRPGSIKSSIPNFKIKTVKCSLWQEE